MRVLITGATGFVGRHLIHHFTSQPHMQLAGTARGLTTPHWWPQAVVYMPAELTDQQQVSHLISLFAPDVVIHGAAMSRPNDCEVQQELCYTVNVQATRYLAEACAESGARLLFISTDFVFGDNGPYAENDAYEPVNYYGQSKMLAEQVVMNLPLPWSIVRTVLVYGAALPGLTPSFPHWVRHNLEAGKTIRVFTDQVRTPTYVLDLVAGIHAMVQQQATGVYHLCGEETFTPFDMAIVIAQYFGFNKSLVQPVTRAEFAEVALRPLRSTLHIHKAKSELGFAPRSLLQVLPQIF